MYQKIKKLPIQTVIEYLSDVRNLGLVAFAIIALLVTWSGIKVVKTNYDLQKQISAMRQANDVKKLENSNVALRNEYLRTDSYLELAARKLHNKALPGERLLVVPEAVALNHTKDIQLEQEEPENIGDIEQGGPWYERNFNAWLDFLLRNQTPEN